MASPDLSIVTSNVDPNTKYYVLTVKTEPDPLMVLPGASAPPTKPTEAIEILAEREKAGFTLPPFLKTIVEGAKKVIGFFTEVVFPFCLKACGFVFQLIGITMLVVGTVHTIVVLCTTPLAIGLLPLLMVLVTSGALPVAVGGASIFHLGHDMAHEKFGALYYILIALPFTGFFGTFFPTTGTVPPPV